MTEILMIVKIILFLFVILSVPIGIVLYAWIIWTMCMGIKEIVKIKKNNIHNKKKKKKKK